MTPQEYLALIVRPNLADLQTKPGDLRFALNAVVAIDALAAHMHRWAVDNKPDVVAGLDDSAYRKELAHKNCDFDVTFQVAKAAKHVRLTRGNIPAVGSVDQVATDVPEWDDIVWDRFRWDIEQVFVHVEGAPAQGLEFVLVDALAFLEGEIANLAAA